ncbi:hypothetical protein C8R43DRAFT_667947 [Mycena crocata]|nr:hypothetical protein C8R43DRAFT_667947 [Mycena crocata]
MAKPKRILFVLAICAVFSIMTFREMPDGDPEMPSNNWRRELDNFEFEWPGLKPTGAAQSPLGLFEGLPSRRIVVTGGGGNIGKHLVRRLLASHTAVTVVDLIFNVEEHDYADPTLLTWITADIRNATALDHALTPDVIGVIHLAAVSRVLWCLANEPDCMDVNERGTGVVLAAIERKPESFRPWFILASSKEVYARKSNQTSPVGDMPLTVYGISKLKAEQVLQGHAHHVDTFSQRSFQAVVLRMSSVYGSLYDHKDRLVSTLVSRALAHQTLQIIGGEQEIDFLYIDDCVNAFILAATRLERKSRTFKDPQVTVEVFDVSGSGSIVLQHLVHKILILTQSKSPIQTFQRDKRFSAHYIRSPKKAALPGYSSKISLDSGLIRLVGFHLEQSASYLQQKMENECAQESQPHVIANQDLLKLDGCQANLLIDIHSEIWSLAFDRNPKHPESPDDMGPGTPEDWGPIWVISENIIPDIVKVAIESREDRFFVQIYADRTYAAHRLGVFAPSLPEFTKGFMFDHIEPDHVGDTAVVEWEMIVNQIEGSFKLVLPDSGYQVQPPTIYDGWFAWISADVEIYPFRLIPICCPAPPPWPFYEQDPIQHSIHLDRSSKLRPFNKTIPQTMCLRVASAITHVQQALAFLGEVRRNGIVGHPRQMGSAADFVDNGRIPCSNDCNHPTICIDTGDCACMASIFCPPLDRFPFSSSLHTTVITYPSPWTDTANASLLQIVERSSWLNVLRPEATRYLGAEPTWPSVHIAAVDATSESMRGPRLESVARLLDRDCFLRGRFNGTRFTRSGCSGR